MFYDDIHRGQCRPVKVDYVIGDDLRYLDWVESRRAYVEPLSGGRIGYVHLPNTAGEGNRELTRQLYPQIGYGADASRARASATSSARSA